MTAAGGLMMMVASSWPGGSTPAGTGTCPGWATGSITMTSSSCCCRNLCDGVIVWCEQEGGR
jgi:hypothetical protein